MDIEVQNYDSPFVGFVDDTEYGNFLGIGSKAKKIDASTDQIKAQAAATLSAADAESQQIAAQVAASEKAAKDALEKAELIKNALEEAKTAQKMNPAVSPTDSKSKMPLIIGGGILVVGIIAVLILKK